MKLIPNWRDVALRAFSMWANYLGILALILPELIFWLTGIDTNPRIWWSLGLGLIVAGIVGRLLSQGGLDGDPNTRWTSPLTVAAALFVVALGQWPGQTQEPAIPADPPAAVGAPSEAATLAYLLPLLEHWEDVRLVAYQDIVGVWTVCMGETQNVQPGDTYTLEECRAMLTRRALEYRAGLHKRLTRTTLDTRLTPQRDAALTSVTYNVGVAGFGGSTSVKRLNAGDIPGSCEALTWWNKAGGRVIRGLVNRRAEEYRLCMIGVAGA